MKLTTEYTVTNDAGRELPVDKDVFYAFAALKSNMEKKREAEIAELEAILAEDKQEYLKLIKIHGVDAIREVIDFCELSGNQHAARCVKKYADNLEKVDSSS